MKQFKEHLLEAIGRKITNSSSDRFIKAGEYDLKGKIKKSYSDTELIDEIEKAISWNTYNPTLKYSHTGNGFIELVPITGSGGKSESVIAKSTFRKYKNYFIVQYRELTTIFAISKN